MAWCNLPKIARMLQKNFLFPCRNAKAPQWEAQETRRHPVGLTSSDEFILTIVTNQCGNHEQRRRRRRRRRHSRQRRGQWEQCRWNELWSSGRAASCRPAKRCSTTSWTWRTWETCTCHIHNLTWRINRLTRPTDTPHAGFYCQQDIKTLSRWQSHVT